MRTLACMFLVITSSCKDQAPPPAPAPAPSPAAQQPPPTKAQADGHIACSDLLTAADLETLCHAKLALATPASDLDDIVPDRTCSRRFSDHHSSVSFMISVSSKPLMPADPKWTNVQPVTGLGAGAEAYES